MTEPPGEDVTVPAAVTRLAGDGSPRAVWRNDLGGVTFAIGERRFVKWSPVGGPDLGVEAERLRWAGAFTPVPVVLELGGDAQGSWMVTAALAGRSAVDRRWLTDPATAVRAAGRGLRALHDALPVESCPFPWDATTRVASAHRRAARLDPSSWSPEHRHLTVEQALDLVGRTPPADRLVVCHGDACVPNTLVGDDGSWCGHVDLGALGVGDRWADLAVATWSTAWNYGPGWEDALIGAYGVEPDPVRTAYYRLLWELGP